MTAQQLEHLMAVIAGMDTVKKLSNFSHDNSTGPPSESEVQQFFDSVTTNNDGTDGGNDPPDPPARRSRAGGQANQYFWRRHYLSIIQEEDEANDRSAASSRAGSRPVSRPASTYDNIFRLSRLSAVSPLAIQVFFLIHNIHTIIHMFCKSPICLNIMFGSFLL